MKYVLAFLFGLLSWLLTDCGKFIRWRFLDAGLGPGLWGESRITMLHHPTQCTPNPNPPKNIRMSKTSTKDSHEQEHPQNYSHEQENPQKSWTFMLNHFGERLYSVCMTGNIRSENAFQMQDKDRAQMH